MNHLLRGHTLNKQLLKGKAHPRFMKLHLNKFNVITCRYFSLWETASHFVILAFHAATPTVLQGEKVA